MAELILHAIFDMVLTFFFMYCCDFACKCFFAFRIARLVERRFCLPKLLWCFAVSQNLKRHSFTVSYSKTNIVFQNFDVFLEAQIENTALVPMILEKVDLDPSLFYHVAPIFIA